MPAPRRLPYPADSRADGTGAPPAITIEPADLPDDVLALLDHHLLDLGGTYGDPDAGDPIQYDELRIEHDQGEVEIVVYNRAILLFTADSEPAIDAQARPVVGGALL